MRDEYSRIVVGDHGVEQLVILVADGLLGRLPCLAVVFVLGRGYMASSCASSSGAALMGASAEMQTMGALPSSGKMVRPKALPRLDLLPVLEGQVAVFSRRSHLRLMGSI